MINKIKVSELLLLVHVHVCATTDLEERCKGCHDIANLLVWAPALSIQHHTAAIKHNSISTHQFVQSNDCKLDIWTHTHTRRHTAQSSFLSALHVCVCLSHPIVSSSDILLASTIHTEGSVFITNGTINTDSPVRKQGEIWPSTFTHNYNFSTPCFKHNKERYACVLDQRVHIYQRAWHVDL